MITAAVTGNLGKDAQLRQTESGPVLGFNVASNSKERGRDVTTWVECSLWGSRGEKLGQYLSRGTRVAVSGTLGTREYEGKTYLTLRVNELDFMGGRNDGQRQHQEPQHHESTEADDFGDAF